LLSESTKTTVVGLRYVGLPLSLQFGRSGVLVLGLDTDPAKVALLNAYIYVRMFFYPFHDAIRKGNRSF
jgi:UDP-N-acetyl-D-mannosaminuronate dehydrogenase